MTRQLSDASPRLPAKPDLRRKGSGGNTGNHQKIPVRAARGHARYIFGSEDPGAVSSDRKHQSREQRRLIPRLSAALCSDHAVGSISLVAAGLVLAAGLV